MCELRALEHALGDPERDPVDEEALPELERRGRRLLEPGEVGQVAAEGVPALRLSLSAFAPPPPQPHCGAATEEQHGVHDRAAAEGDQDDVAPARRDRTEARDADGEQHDGEQTKTASRRENHRAAVVEPALLVDRLVDVALERGEALGVRRPVLRDPVAELGEPLRLAATTLSITSATSSSKA